MSAVLKKIEEASGPGAGEYLTFRLGKEEYGIDILKVQEIRGYEDPTRVANAPPFIKGVSNLRGTIVPIVDMRLRFGCESAEYNHLTVVIILNLRERVVGVVVDSVSDVIELGEEQLRPAPDIESAIDARCIRGLGAVGERMLILLDIERLMNNPDMGLVLAQA
ncbi:chemotaxis protein CheW [Comamonas flocculans]|uniref:Chemotaxis protein CheW n=1 Tax=Comamonas flocculans TaxID=2597701 RepID=A0A5B8RV56_9BURK|nr:chemotaxis protein CheW [Comamonas flocculans]QEA12554.1 chemotaxis protein CheW [Comamonas flocculans]